MSFTIRATLEVPQEISKIFLIQNTEQLKDFMFSETEIEYIEKKYRENEKEKSPLVIINRLSQLLAVVKPTIDEPLEIIKERMRRRGAEILSGLKAEKNEKAAIIDLISNPPLTLAIAEGLALNAYSFNKYKTGEKNSLNYEFLIVSPQVKGCDIAKLTRVIESVYLARDLVNEPVGYLNAEKLGELVLEYAEKFGFKAEVFNKKKIESLKMGGLLAVNKGSIDPPTFSVLEWKPENAVNSKPYVIAGKGVMFDTGGVNLKTPPGSLDTMKCDMGGAASVIGTMAAVAANELPVHVIGLIPATDNRLGGHAIVPGDILKMHNGLTVEVINTDAEGRLILADALSFSKKYDPELVIDLATLTGNAAIAIGIHGIVAMGTAPQTVQNELNNAGDEVCERLVWFPFWEDYDKSIKSDIADIKNLGEREGGAISAGKFLGKFVDAPWVHLDIAGPAYVMAAIDYRPTGGTGVGVRLLYQFFNRKSSS
ncbi:leucyl aminopeptidase family protein [Natronoflexus pectinivorans]|uniref:Leucyl aminopeptidase n=1 Tax=Natronoflexus pectinivorans TaxID=682526 RepID=A0A4R2GHR0_9BACT|nr:leucyl aminopeptidase [Natronoflexus pectinivorans]TCO07977.1 leucyl aminopeptidase [Natronoflexus pectinivorans]